MQKPENSIPWRSKARPQCTTVQTTAIDNEAGLIRLTTTLAHSLGEWMSSILNWRFAGRARLWNWRTTELNALLITSRRSRSTRLPLRWVNERERLTAMFAVDRRNQNRTSARRTAPWPSRFGHTTRLSLDFNSGLDVLIGYSMPVIGVSCGPTAKLLGPHVLSTLDH